MPRRREKGPEAATQDLILDWLAAEHILAFRMNTGATVIPETATTRRRFIAYGVEGMADILCFPTKCRTCRIHCDINECHECRECWLRPRVLWIEVKSPTGKQSPVQISFAQQVESYGHVYLVARSLEDVLKCLQEK